MKSILALIVLLPAVSFGGQIFYNDQLEWSGIGSAVVKGKAYFQACVKGDEVTESLSSPEIVYRLRSIKENYDGGKTSKLVAEMIIVDKTVSLTNLTSNLNNNLSESNFNEVCGEGFLSKMAVGARIAYTMILDTNEAQKIPSIEILETDSSQATIFFNKVKEVTSNLKTVRGSGVEMIGTLQIPSTPMDETFVAYKAKVLSDSTLRRYIGAESDVYPKSVLKEIIK